MNRGFAAARRAVIAAMSLLLGFSTRQNVARAEESGKWSGTSLRMGTIAEAAARLRAGGTSVLPMARYPDPILRQIAEEVPESAFKSPEELDLLSRALESTAQTEGAVGLAASQVGVNARMIVLDQRVLGRAAPRVLVGVCPNKWLPFLDQVFKVGSWVFGVAKPILISDVAR